MENTFTLSGKYPPIDTKPVIDEALRKQTDFAHARFSKFEKECGEFESRFGMNSEEFLAKFESGELGDAVHWFDWYAALRGKRLWAKKYDILQSIAWKA
ncbi:MAG: hypothetical protein ACOC23_06365 [Thermodesulfobacteriota bacterium]